MLKSKCYNCLSRNSVIYFRIIRVIKRLHQKNNGTICGRIQLFGSLLLIEGCI
jgi:hypothetical protein